MPTVNCDHCGHSVKVEDGTKKYKLPLFFIFLGITILVYENLVSNPSLIITIIGATFATAGLVWLVITRFRSLRKL